MRWRSSHSIHLLINFFLSFLTTFLPLTTSCQSMYIVTVIIFKNKLQFDKNWMLRYKITSVICNYGLLGEGGCNFLAAWGIARVFSLYIYDFVAHFLLDIQYENAPTFILILNTWVKKVWRYQRDNQEP